jgi:hypothetical protein
MRVANTTAIVFMGAAALFAAGEVFAQGTYQGTYPGTPPTPGAAQMPYATGARPGNVIGTGDSLPLSNNASNIGPSDTTNAIAPRLPSPNLGEGSSPRDFLIAARQALAGNRTGEAQEALERAETRALAGNVLATDINQPSQQLTIRNIASARQALASGNKSAAIQAIDIALQGL